MRSHQKYVTEVRIYLLIFYMFVNILKKKTDYYAPTNLTISGPSMVIAGDNPVYFSCKANAFPEASMRFDFILIITSSVY